MDKNITEINFENELNSSIQYGKKKEAHFEINFDKIIDYARKCPSGDNCQPWKFKVTDNKLLVWNDLSKSNHVLNYREVASLFSFGMMAEIIQIAASEQGLFAMIKCTDYQNPKLLVAFEPGAIKDELICQIDRREVDRREYKGGDINDQVFHEILLTCYQYANVEVSLLGNDKKEIKKYIEKNDYKFAYWKKGFLQTLKWMRFSKRDLEHRNGLPWRNLGLKSMDKIILSAMKKFNIIYDFMSTFRMWAPAKLVARRQVNSAAGFMLISLKDFKDETVFSAGRFFMRSWLKLTEKEYKIQPHTSGSLPMYYLERFEDFFNSLPNNMAKHYLSQRRKLGRIFKAKGTPFFLLRVGKNSELPENMKAPRFSVDEIKA